MTIPEYISALNKLYKAGIATEHSYRGDLKILIESLVSGITVTNEPSHIACGAPDYILTRRNIPIGYIEAKDINKPLDAKEYKEQFDRYRNSLPNLIITDYLEFRLFRDGEFVTSVRIGNAASGAVVGLPENYDTFARLITDFCAHISQTIKSSSKLAKMMAGKARLLANVIQSAIESDEHSQQFQVNEAANNTLRQQMSAFRDILIHDIKPNEFADIYAQTIAYGMFAARLHDPTMTDFTRQEAAELIPKSNPFLRKLFQYVAGYDLDDRIRWIVDDLADIFRACDVAAILNNFGKSTQQEDPVIHFYETFLSEYNPALRKARGVWYTPQPVVNFIVRAVDDILKTEFGLTQGLADSSKIKIKVNESGKQVEKEVHRVQILDPACGTGTFLAEVIRQVYAKFNGQQGIWPHYAEEHLIPRLNGFELLMASYAMAHLKLGLQLKETGYEDKSNKRLRVYLTNSLEEYHPDTGTLFAGWLSDEANEANRVKRDTPVMVVLGNPPYSVSSSNKSKWIEGLLVDYKKNLNEKNIQPLSDDYIKFIRFGQHFIDKNGSGILAYISNNSFIDGLIHRQMRKSLLKSFDKIYILDLHGNAKKKEVCPDGSPDQNVFDIMQGVSINILIKKPE
ncbi:MAG TPA: N-6 DNA methylase [Bacteroidales bacterium]|nr:N-6 DNA methylase [Bacteroidales bacterium]